MSAAWDRVHERFRLTERVLADVRRHGLSRALSRWTDDIEATFGSVDDFLAAVARRWNTALNARVEAALDEGAGALEDARRIAERELSRDDPATRRLLDAFSAHSEVEAADRRRDRLFAAFGSTEDRQAAAPPTHTSVRAPRRRRRCCPARAALALLMRSG